MLRDLLARQLSNVQACLSEMDGCISRAPSTGMVLLPVGHSACRRRIESDLSDQLKTWDAGHSLLLQKGMVAASISVWHFKEKQQLSNKRWGADVQ